MSVYLRTSSADGTIITGHVLHLAVWAPDEPGTTLMHGGRWVPLCSSGTDRPMHYRPTGVGWYGWHRHAHWPVCSRCRRRSWALVEATDAQDAREREHAVRNRCPAPTPGFTIGTCGLVRDHDGPHVVAMMGRLVRWGLPRLTPPAAPYRERETR